MATYLPIVPMAYQWLTFCLMVIYMELFVNVYINNISYCLSFIIRTDNTRDSQPVIAHLVFNLTSKVDRKWECYT